MIGAAMHNRSSYLLIAPAALTLAIFFLVPMAQVLWLSFSEPSFGFHNYRELIQSDVIHRVWWNTLRVCVATTFFAILLGYPVAYAMAHSNTRHRNIMVTCIVLTFWLSVLIRAFAWVVLLRANGLINTLLIDLGIIYQPLRLVRNEMGVLIGMVHYMLPIAVLPMYANMRTVSGRYVDAARGLGASASRAFFLVYLPLTKPGIIAAAILVFIITLGFYITPAILGGGRVIMIAEFIRMSFDETLRWGYATMLASSLLIVVALLLFILSRLVDLRKVFGA